MKLPAIFHGPIVIGGIGWHLAEGQRKRGFKSDCIVYSDNGNRQLHHLNLNINEYKSTKRHAYRLLYFLKFILCYDIFHFYSGSTLLPYNIDLPILRLLGKKIIMTYCGSDIRLIRVEKRRNKYAHLLKIGLNDSKYDRLKIRQMHWQNLWIQKFTAIRDLYEHAIEVIPPKKILTKPWLNNIGFDVASAPISSSLSTRKIPKIIHAPSNRAIKGSEYVTKAILILRERGIEFDYQELHGVPNDEVQNLISDCDIVIDQFLLGSIGTFAFEGMGYGKPVMAYLPKSVETKYMQECPIYKANIENLADRLEELIKSPELRLDLGRKGIEYVKKNLDYPTIQDKVVEIYHDL